MATEGVNGLAVGVMAAGLLLVWSGIKGASVTSVLRSLLSGQQPSGANTEPITTPVGSAPTGGGSPGLGGSPAPLSNTSPGHSGGPGGGGLFDHSQLMALWQQAGGSAGTANNAACHAIQESSGNPNAESPNPDGGTNVGLWQLDTPGGKGHGFSIAQLKNPLTNARVAVMGSRNGTDWSAWATPGC